MAADRSLMAWVRTGLSMISFGFTVYKLLQAAQANGAVLLAAVGSFMFVSIIVGLA